MRGVPWRVRLSMVVSAGGRRLDLHVEGDGVGDGPHSMRVP